MRQLLLPTFEVIIKAIMFFGFNFLFLRFTPRGKLKHWMEINGVTQLFFIAGQWVLVGAGGLAGSEISETIELFGFDSPVRLYELLALRLRPIWFSYELKGRGWTRCTQAHSDLLLFNLSCKQHVFYMIVYLEFNWECVENEKFVRHEN